MLQASSEQASRNNKLGCLFHVKCNQTNARVFGYDPRFWRGGRSSVGTSHSCREPTNSNPLVWKRMPEEEAQHFPRCVRSLRISVGARRATSRPCVAGAVDIPVLQDFAPAPIDMGRAGIGVASRYLPAMHLFLRARRTHGLFKNLVAIVWMHCGVPVAVENDCRHGQSAA